MEPNEPASGLGDVDATLTGPWAPPLVRPAHPRPHRHAHAAAPAGTGTALDTAVDTGRLRFEEFYEAHRAPITRALAVTLRDADLAGDAVDEAMARAYQRWTTVRDLDNPAGWVYRVAMNWSLSFLRRATRRPPIWMAEGASVEVPPALDPAIDRALAELSVDQRAVVVLRFLFGYSEAQTADALDIRPGTVKSRLSRALDRLREQLGSFGEEVGR